MTQSPLIATAGLTTCTAVVGDLSMVRIRDLAPALSETQYAVTENGGIRVYDWDGSNVREPLPPSPGVTYAGLQIHGSLNKVFYFEPNATTIYCVSLAGGPPQPLLTRERMLCYRVSPDGRRCAYCYETSGGYHVCWGRLDGSDEHEVDNGFSTNITWIDDDRFMKGPVCYNIKTGQTGTVTELTVADHSASPNGRYVAAIRDVGSNPMKLVLFPVVNGMPTKVGRIEAGDLPTGAIHLGWNGDSSRVMCTTASGELYSVNPFLASDRTLFLQSTLNGGWPFFDWQPPAADRPVVGARSPTPGGAGGIVLLERGPEIGGFVLFDAKTRTTGRITRETGGAEGALNTVLRYEADAVKRISYTVDRSYLPVPILPPLTGANGALVSFDNETAEIVSVMYYKVSRSSGRPEVVRRGAATQIRGEWLGAFDGQGKPLAVRSGALVLEGTTVR